MAMSTATMTARATATATAMAIAMAMATEMATMTKGGLPLHVPAMCGAVAGANLASTPMDTKESAFTSAASWG